MQESSLPGRRMRQTIEQQIALHRPRSPSPSLSTSVSQRGVAKELSALAVLLLATYRAPKKGSRRKMWIVMGCCAGFVVLRYLSSWGDADIDIANAPGKGEASADEAPGRSAAHAPSLSVNAKEEAIYPRTYIDSEGNVLDGAGHYRIRGELQMPAVWWSLTIYDESFSLIPNGGERHSFTSFNIVPAEDRRSFVIDVAPQHPDDAVNWLPCKPGETFNLVWRFYLPGAEIFHDRNGFELPKVVPVRD